MPDRESFLAIFERLKSILESLVPPLLVEANTPDNYSLLVPPSPRFARYHIPIPNHKEWGHKPPTLYEMHQAISIIQTSVKNSQPVVVHCERGLGRTGTVIAGYLTTCGFPAQEAIKHIRKLRPGSIETEEQEAVIYEYERIHTALL